MHTCECQYCGAAMIGERDLGEALFCGDYCRKAAEHEAQQFKVGLFTPPAREAISVVEKRGDGEGILPVDPLTNISPETIMLFCLVQARLQVFSGAAWGRKSRPRSMEGYFLKEE